MRYYDQSSKHHELLFSNNYRMYNFLQFHSWNKNTSALIKNIKWFRLFLFENFSIGYELIMYKIWEHFQEMLTNWSYIPLTSSWNLRKMRFQELVRYWQSQIKLALLMLSEAPVSCKFDTNLWSCLLECKWSPWR